MEEGDSFLVALWDLDLPLTVEEKGRIHVELVEMPVNLVARYFMPPTPEGKAAALRSLLDYPHLRSVQLIKFVSGDNIMKWWEGFEDAVLPCLEKLPLRKDDYRCKFPSARQEVCSIRGEPCLLWDGVGEGTVELDSRFLNRLKADQLTVVLSPSGSGKTRQLIELASRKPTLFFTGHRLLSGFGGGSEDVRTVVEHLERLFAGYSSRIAVPNETVKCCVGGLLLVRLLFFGLLKRLNPDLSPMDWAFFQLEYPAVEDCMKVATNELLRFIVNRDEWIHFGLIFHDLLEQVASKVGWENGVIVLDESQALLKDMPSRFKSTLHPTEGQSFLNPFVLALSKFKMLQSPVFISGTGKGMLAVGQQFFSFSGGGNMKTVNIDVLNIYRLDGFEPNEIFPFLVRFIDTSKFEMKEMEAISETYRARRRNLVTALERYITEPNPASSWFLSFALQMTVKTGVQRGVQRTLADDAAAAWALVDMQVLQSILFTYYLSGHGAVVVPAKQYAVALLDCGLGYMYERDEAEDVFVPFLPEVDDVESLYGAQGGEIIIWEPLVMTALWHSMPGGTLMQRFLDISATPTARGLNYESFICVALGPAFDNEIPSEVLGIQGAAEVYDQVYDLVKSKAAGCLVQSISDDADLNAWVEGVKDERPSFATYAHTGPWVRSGLSGPDILFLLRSSKGDIMPVFVQLRTGENVNVVTGFATLDVVEFNRRVNCEGSRQLLTWARKGYIQLLVTTPVHSRQRAFEVRRQSARLNSETDMVSPICGIWADQKLRGIMEDGKPKELWDAMTNLEERRNKRRRTSSFQSAA